MGADDLLEEALRLPRQGRARLAEELLASLEEDDDEVAAAWAAELARRSRDAAEGKVQVVEWDVAREQISREIEQRRARRAAS